MLDGGLSRIPKRITRVIWGAKPTAEPERVLGIGVDRDQRLFARPNEPPSSLLNHPEDRAVGRPPGKSFGPRVGCSSQGTRGSLRPWAALRMPRKMFNSSVSGAARKNKRRRRLCSLRDWFGLA